MHGHKKLKHAYLYLCPSNSKSRMSLGIKQESQPRETTGFEPELNYVRQVMNVGPETGYSGDKFHGFI